MAANRDTDPRENAPVDTDAVDIKGLTPPPGMEADLDISGLAPPEPQAQPQQQSTFAQQGDMYEGYPADVEQALKRSAEFVRGEFGDEVADAITKPGASLDSLPDGVTIEDVWDAVEPVMSEDLPAWQAASEFRAQYAEQGGNPDALNWNYLRAMATFMGEQAAGDTEAVSANLAEARSWWGKLKGSFANRASTVMQHPDFQVGLQTLDFFTWINKKSKLAFVPRSERAEVEQRVLPHVTLDDGSSYQIATGQAIENLWGRAWGANTQLNGWAVENIGKLLGSETLQEVGRASKQRGGEQRARASENISEVASLMGDHLSWTEVVERNDPATFVDVARVQMLAVPGEEWDRIREEVKAADSIDPLLAFLQHQPGGTAVMQSWAITDGVAELALDPSLIAGEALAKAPAAVQAATRLRNPAKNVAITSKVARETRRFEDAQEAVNAAKYHVKRVEQQSAEVAARNGGQITREQAINLSNARRQLANEESWMARRSQDAGKNDVIIPRARRTNPDHPSINTRTTEQYVDSYHVAGGTTTPEYTERSISKVQETIGQIQKEMAATSSARDTKVAASLKSQIDEIAAEMESIRGRAIGVESRGGKLYGSAREKVKDLQDLRVKLNKVRKRLDEAGPEREVNPAWARLEQRMEDAISSLEGLRAKEGLTIEHGARVEMPATRQVGRPVDEVARELHEMRVKELGRDADRIMPRTDQTEGLPLFGMDDTEQAGDALNHVVRTGGVGIDDVWLHQPNPLHQTLPEGFGGADSAMGLIDWRALDQANDITKTERQFMSSGASKQYEMGYSTRRSLHRQLDIAKRNLGAARQRGDKVAIEAAEGHVTSAKNAIRAVKDDKTIMAADKKFDSVAWLGGETPGIQSDPGRFSSMLEKFGDMALETAYPGGFGIRRLQQSRFGQAFIPFREPQRFYETFAPDTWDRVSSGMHRYHGQTQAWNERLIHHGQQAGILKKRSKWDPRSHFSPYEVDEVKNELLFDLLDTRTDTDKFAELAAKADPKLLEFHDDLRRQMDHWADLQGIGKGPDSPRYLSGYMRHAVTADQFAGGARPLEYIGVPKNADVFVSHLMPRRGTANVRKDAMAVLDLYGRAASRKIHVEPIFDDIIATGTELAEQYKNPQMVQYANDLVSELSGKPTPWMARIDQFMGWAHDSMPSKLRGGKTWEPGAIDRSLTGLSGLLWAGMLPGNMRYGPMAIATGIATTSGRYGLFRTARGLFAQATREGQAVARASGTYDEFLNIFESDKMRKFSKLMAEKGYTFSPMGVMSTGQAEEFIRGMTFHAAVDMHMTKMGISTWAEAAKLGYAQRIAFEAMRSATEVNHMFGALGRSPMLTRGVFQSKGIATSTTQFLSFMPKQTEELLSQANRNPGYIARYMAMSGAICRVAAETGGVDMTNYVGLAYGPQVPSDLQSPAMSALLDVVGVVASVSDNDRVETARHGRSLLDNLDNLIPMMVLAEGVTRGAERLTTGKSTSMAGNLNRELDMGEFDISNITLEGIGSAMGPAGLNTPDVTFPTAGGDFFPSLFGQQAIRDKLHRRGMEAIDDKIDRYMFDAQVKIGELQDALMADDPATAQEVLDILRTDYGLIIDPKRALESRIYSQNVGAVFRRLVNRASKQQKAEVYEEAKRHGIVIE